MSANKPSSSKKGGDSDPPPLEGALKAVNLLVQQKIMYGKKDEVGLVLCGTQETDNPLSDTGYEHITVARDLTVPDLDLLRFIEQIGPSEYTGDLSDALIVAMDMLNKKTMKKRYQRRVFLVTDAKSPVNQSDWDKIVDFFKKMEAHLNIIGINFLDEEEQLKAKGTEKVLRKLADDVEGIVVPIHQALEMMSYLRSRSVLQVICFCCCFCFCCFFCFCVWAFTKCTMMKFPSLKQTSDVAMQAATPGTCAVQLERMFCSMSDPDLVISDEEVLKGYKYGKSYIPFSKYDEKLMRYSASKCMQLIGFTDSHSVPRHHLLGSVECVCAEPGEMNASIALSALIHALAETDSVAIVRYVAKNSGNVKLAVLSPCIKASYECLYLAALPFSEDLRQYQFAPLDAKNIKKKFKPDEEQLKAAQDLIHSLDLTTAALDSEGQSIPALKARYTYNPVLQRFNQSVQHRAMKPNTPLPTLDPIIEQYVNPDIKLFEQASKVIKEVSAKFPLMRTESSEKNRRKMWGHANNDEVRLESYVPDPNSKKRKIEGQGDFSLEKLVSIGTNDVGSINPVQDFKDMISRRDVDLVEKAVEQMKGRILQLVNDSINTQFYGKAIECLKALREGCLFFAEGLSFISFLHNLKYDYEGKRRDDFWRLLAPNGLTLIHCDEADDTTVTAAEAQAFLAPPSASQPVSDTPDNKPKNDDVDDLLDQIE
eukprot:Phypoly_transcript_02644.p1 GENE.Phypoly_transcript_02644~~Phypoly_transcript_02644.p1  ORF type:complete len:733 (-),score=115.46 Phypoly_transcript_02644:534-2660(-)